MDNELSHESQVIINWHIEDAMESLREILHHFRYYPDKLSKLPGWVREALVIDLEKQQVRDTASLKLLEENIEIYKKAMGKGGADDHV